MAVNPNSRTPPPHRALPEPARKPRHFRSMAMPTATIELARRQLKSMWKAAKLNFKYFAPEEIAPPELVPVPSSKTAKAIKTSETPPAKLTAGEEFHALLGIPRPPGDTGKGKAKKEHGSSGASGSGSGSGSALVELRKGWVPFGTWPKSDKVKNTRPAAPKRKLDKPTDDCLSPVSPPLPMKLLPKKLGRSDVFGKRKHHADTTPAEIVVGKDDVHNEALAQKMRRGQAYAVHDNRANIMLECVAAYRAA